MITKTVGTGGDYADIGAMWDALSLPDGTVSWVDDYDIVQISDFTEPSRTFTSKPFFDEHILTIRNPNKYVITLPAMSYSLQSRYQGEPGHGGGYSTRNSVVFDGLIIDASAWGNNVWILNNRPGNVDDYLKVVYKNITILGKGSVTSQIGINLYGVGTSDVIIQNCRMYGLHVGILTGNYSWGTSTNKLIENCASYKCDYGIVFGTTVDSGSKIKNTVCSESTVEDFNSDANVTTTEITNCADSDGSIASSGAVLSGNITGIVDGDFLSVVPGNDFLKINRTSALCRTGSAAISSWNNFDIDGKPRPDVLGKVSIGVYEVEIQFAFDFTVTPLKGIAPLESRFTSSLLEL
jgi:hypothetical protein